MSCALVTGVQTGALPISERPGRAAAGAARAMRPRGGRAAHPGGRVPAWHSRDQPARHGAVQKLRVARQYPPDSESAPHGPIGRARCWESVFEYSAFPVVAVAFKKNTSNIN